MGKLIYGVGVNDAWYPTIKWHRFTDSSGKEKRRAKWRCQYYRRWTSMIERCYSERYLSKFPTYKEVSVCEQWKKFSNFRSWMIGEEDKLGDLSEMRLDKDILSTDGKIYSPETCCFIHRKINYFVSGGVKDSINGASFHKASGMIQAKCGNPLTGKESYIGLFDNFDDAKLAWMNKKHEIACELAKSDLVKEDKIKKRLCEIYAV